MKYTNKTLNSLKNYYLHYSYSLAEHLIVNRYVIRHCSLDNLDQTVSVISDYIAFCEDMIIPKKLIKSFSNSKSWITKELIKTINKK